MAKILAPLTGLLAYLLEKATNPFVKREFGTGNVKSICVLLLQGIGNTILFLPVIEELQKKFPGARITAVAKKESAELLAAYKSLIILEYKANSPFFERLKFFIELRRSSFDIVAYSRPNRYMMPSILCFFLGGYRLLHKYPVGLYQNCDFLNSAGIEFDENISDVLNNLNLLKPLGIKPVFAVPRLAMPKEVEDKMVRFLNKAKPRKKKVCLHIGCAQPIRIWPLEHFIELTRKLVKKYDCSIILIGGASEEEIVKKYTKSVNVPVIDASCKFSAVETTALIKQCDLLITVDSGPQHMAVSVGTPVISIYGPSSGKIDTQPVGRHDKILSLRLPCSPCVKRNSFLCPLGTHFCLRGLSPDLVLESVRKYIA